MFSVEFKKSCPPQLRELSKLDLCGVLDIKWPDKRLDDKAVFGLVDAEGFCRVNEQRKMYILNVYFINMKEMRGYDLNMKFKRNGCCSHVK